MAARSKTDGLVHLLRRESMSKGVAVSFNEDGSVSLSLHIVVDHGVNLKVLAESIMADDDSGASRVSFSVTCTYGTNPYLNSQNPYQKIIAPSPSPNAAAESAAPSDNAGGNS